MSGAPRRELCGSHRLTPRYEIDNPIFGCSDCGLPVSKLAWDGTDTTAWNSEEFCAHEYWQTHQSELHEVGRILGASGWLVLRVPSEDTLLCRVRR